jgi:hypothetical protein
MRWISFSAAILFCGLAFAADEPGDQARLAADLLDAMDMQAQVSQSFEAAKAAIPAQLTRATIWESVQARPSCCGSNWTRPGSLPSTSSRSGSLPARAAVAGALGDRVGARLSYSDWSPSTVNWATYTSVFPSADQDWSELSVAVWPATRRGIDSFDGSNSNL